MENARKRAIIAERFQNRSKRVRMLTLHEKLNIISEKVGFFLFS
jgi:hypothetical protein